MRTVYSNIKQSSSFDLEILYNCSNNSSQFDSFVNLFSRRWFCVNILYFAHDVVSSFNDTMMLQIFVLLL